MATEKIITPPFTVWFPSVFEKTQVPGSNSDPKYAVTMLFDKADENTGPFIKRLRKLEKQEIQRFWKGKTPSKLHLSILDGDSEEQLAKSKNRSEGYWIIKTTSVSKPQVILRNGLPCPEDDFYAGVIARASIILLAFDKVSKGVGCYFNNIIRWEDGTPLGSNTKAADDFADFIEPDNASRAVDDYDDDDDDDDDVEI